MRTTLASAAIAVAVFFVVGCMPGVTISTGPDATTITGTFAAEARGDAGCAWLETSEGERIEVTYPDGWQIALDPVALYDDQGQLRASAGGRLTIDGYFPDVGDSVCHPQLMFVATKVSAAES
jgi:hypothetical protein